ncbi:universal stress protein [Hymenobacter arizonensis]|uniref:Universal stress protein family protein n=1 Tax=Hymenobacter arizonensis TaxID=1227077 RepID=A0A1I5UIM9_HYMAR|nr:universal stress protein [Hymenobacter arizonensis]SFP94476.1 Universal stress protein family protein [Hymenobacter arizonensis]
MNPAFVVLVNHSAAAEQAARYAAVLGGPLGVQLELVHVYQDPMLLSEMAFAPVPYLPQLQSDADEALQALAERLPAAEATVLAAPMPYAVQEAIDRFQPLLLAMSLSAEQGLADYLLRNHLLPVLRATHHPLLLVPETGPPPALPRRVLVAVDAEYFALSAASLALAPLLASWPAAFSVVHVRHIASGFEQPVPERLGGSLRELLPVPAPLELCGDAGHDPAAAVLRAVADAQADLLVLIARPRSFLGRLFHRSVTAEVLRGCPVPVLLLPADAPDQPDWMPAMS